MSLPLPPPITASTRVAAVIGDPVRHSLSPTIHNAAFAAAGIDAVYVALPVAAGQAAQAVAAMRTFDWLGLSVTMPHKHEILAACDDLTPAAQALGAVNCVFRRDGSIIGDNTDGDGFVRGLRADLGFDPRGMQCVVVGAGGAAKAIVRSLAGAGASAVVVVNRSEQPAIAAAALAGASGRVGDVGDLGRADLVVNATPLGMAGTAGESAVPFDVAALRPDVVVADLIYHPHETPLLRAARVRGLRSQNGLPMLVHQAVAQFEHWTGVPAPVDTMTAAVEAAVAARAG